MKLPKYINLFDAPVNEKKHSGQLNYQRVNDLLSEFEAVEIGEIIAAGFIYEIYGIELDLNDDETKELFPHLQDRACRTQYRQLLTDFDVNSKTYGERIEQKRKAANIRWHGKGGKVKQEPEQEQQEAPAAADGEGMTEEELKSFLAGTEKQSSFARRKKPDLSMEELRELTNSLRALYPTYDSYRNAVLQDLEAGKITTKDKFYLLEYGKERY